MSTPPQQFGTTGVGSSRTQKRLNGALLFEVPESLRLVSDLGASAFGVDDLGLSTLLIVVFGNVLGEPPKPNRWLPLWLRLSWWFLLLFNPFWGRPVAIVNSFWSRARMDILANGTLDTWHESNANPVRNCTKG